MHGCPLTLRQVMAIIPLTCVNITINPPFVEHPFE